jgi:beta-fructofuranosidase
MSQRLLACCSTFLMLIAVVPVIAQEPITDKTMVVWAAPANLTQRGGSALTVDMADPDAFDAIVFGELAPEKWMAGSTLGKRNQRNQEAYAVETAGPDQFVQIAIVYQGKRVTIYRNGQTYAAYDMPESPQTFDKTATLIIGPRHRAGWRDCFVGKIKDARIYPGALEASTIVALQPGKSLDGFVPWAWWDFTGNAAEDRTGNWKYVQMRGDAKIENGALVIGPQHGSFLAKTANVLSPLPKFAFPTTLEEQVKALQDNPLVQRFAAARAHSAGNRHKPIYHFVQPEGYLNDPNGLSFWRGKWHLFYQWIPPETNNALHWGHALSDDLVHWKDLPPAIYPGPEQGAWSGSVYLDDNRAIAAYFGNECGAMIATSDDPLLLNWTKVGNDAVIPIPTEPEPYAVFDACVWKEGTRYYLLTAGTLPKGRLELRRPAWFLFESSDLATWSYVHPFVEDDFVSRIFDDGACPYFWPIGPQDDPATRRHMLIHYSHTSGGKYLLGHYDTEEKKFYTGHGGKFNHGASWPCGVHAPSFTPDGHGGLVGIFNMNHGQKPSGWTQIMSLPILVTLLNPNEIGIQPHPALTALRREHIEKQNVALGANQEVVFDDVHGSSMEFRFVLAPRDASVVEMSFFRSPNREEVTTVRFYRNRGYIDHLHPGNDSVVEIDSSHSAATAMDIRPVEQANVYIPPGDPVDVRVFIDRSVLEVFVAGRQVAAVRVFPSREDSDGVSILSVGADSVLQSFDAWQMEDIYR